MSRETRRFSSAIFPLCLIMLCLDASTGWSQQKMPSGKHHWAEGSPGTSNGATRDYYNRAGLLRWEHFMGDWRDSSGVAQGDGAYAMAEVVDDDRGKFVQWELTDLVRAWQNGTHQNQGVLLRSMQPGGNVLFASREHPQPDQRPSLIVIGERGSREFKPVADTFLTKSTYRSQGRGRELRVSSAPDHALLRFDIRTEADLGRISQATLRLYSTRQYGTASIGVFRCQQGHSEPAQNSLAGLAARFPRDQRIDRDPAVIFATGFESPSWHDEWTYVADRKVIGTVSRDARRKFEPLEGKALRVRIAKGSTGALNTLFKFQPQMGNEPEEIYFRYYLRLADDWRQTLQGGKLPGVSGTYGVAGWGGRPSNGKNGWSARGLFQRTIPAGNPLAGTTPIGTYCYHADMQGSYGSNWVWQKNYRGYLVNNRWYSIEQYLKLNTSGKKDGVLRAWVDGFPAFEKTDIRFRQVDNLKIEQVWMNVYHGGKQPSPHDQHVFIDNVVVATKYIGPMSGRP